VSCTAVEAWGSRYDVAAMATPQRLRHIETLPHYLQVPLTSQLFDLPTNSRIFDRRCFRNISILLSDLCFLNGQSQMRATHLCRPQVMSGCWHGTELFMQVGLFF